MDMENGTPIDNLPLKIVIFLSYVTLPQCKTSFFVTRYRCAKGRDDVQALSQWLEFSAPQQGSTDS